MKKGNIRFTQVIGSKLWYCESLIVTLLQSMITESQSKTEEEWKMHREGENHCVVDIPILNFLILDIYLFSNNNASMLAFACQIY